MGKTRNTGFSNNAIQYNNGSIAFVSGSTTLLNISSSGAIVTTGTITSSTLVTQTVTSSVIFVTGSTKFGALSSNTHTFTGSIYTSGSLTIRGTNTVGASLPTTTAGLFAGRLMVCSGSNSMYLDVSSNCELSTYNYATGTTSNLIFQGNGGGVGIGTNVLNYAKLNVYNNETDITYGPKIQAVFGPSDYLDSDATNVWGGGTSETQFTVGNTARPAMLSLGGNVNTGEGMGVINFFRSSNTDTYKSRVQIWTGVNTTGTANQHGGFLAISTAADGSTNPTERMRITSAGNVGIGETNPTNTQSDRILAIKGSYPGIVLESTGVAKKWGINANWGGGVAFLDFYDETAGASRMRITSGGYVNITTTSNPLPSNATPQLAVVGGAGTDAVAIKHTVDGNNTLNIWQTGTSQHNAIAFYKGDSQTNRGNITVNTSGTSYNSVSDYRLKENIVPLENGLDRLMQLKPSKFNWIETGDEAEGFIAHEVQEIFPDAVTGEKDATYASTGNIKPQSVDYGRITPLLVKAIQELKAENDALKTRIETLENK